MDKIKQLCKDLEDQIGLDNQKGVVNRLRYHAKSNTDLYTNVILISSRFIALEKARHRGTEPSKDLNLESNKIRESILHLIQSITPENIRWENPDAHILVVCREKHQEDWEYLEKFFSVSNQENWKITHALGEPDDLNVDLIVFDNFRWDKDNSNRSDELHLKLFEKLVNISVAPILYCGDYTKALEKLRDRVNAANSPFTMIPRIRETLEFAAQYKGTSKAPWNR
jgi:hypothetical protein